MIGVLSGNHDADAPRALDGPQVTGIIDTGKPVTVRRNKAIPLRLEFDRVVVVGRSTAKGEDVDARGSKRGEVFGRERGGISQPPRGQRHIVLPIVVEGKLTEHVDYRGLLHQRNGARRVFGCALREQTIASTQDGRRGERGHRGGGHAAEGGPAIHNVLWEGVAQNVFRVRRAGEETGRTRPVLPERQHRPVHRRVT